VSVTSLSGRRVIVTREDPGALAELLDARGAEMLHVPTIVTQDPLDGGDELRRELGALGDDDWLVVTSPEGARRVAPTAAATRMHLAAVGTATAKVLEGACGRAVDIVPDTQRADALAAALLAALEPAIPDGASSRRPRVLVAQADLAGDELSEALRAAGHDVVTVVAYRTSLAPPAHLDRTPGHDRNIDPDPGIDPDRIIDPVTADRIEGADAVLFASGSAVRGWVAGVGRPLPPIVIAIGPSTTAVAHELGVPVSRTAAEHSLLGLVTELEAALDAPLGGESDRR
jgi:uroporphyrinogen-III synthase